mgnify:CR=1 FL=1
MSMTMTQKILAKHAGLESVVAGQLIEAKLDMVLGNDVTSPVAINEMTKFGKNSVFDKTKISLVMDHFTPNKDIQSAQNCKQVREFAKKYDITHYYDVGNMGIEHALLPEQEVIDEVEKYLDDDFDSIPYATGDKIGRTVDYFAGRNRYMGYLMTLAKHSYRNIKVGLDCSNGSAFMIAKSVYDALGAKTYVINNEPNGVNINTNCGSTHIEVLQEYVKEKHLDIGFAYDGDADRCIAVDEKGNVIDGDLILYVCGKYLMENGRLNGDTIVTTVMSNLGLYKACDKIGMKYEQTAVGDKYVYENMLKNGYVLGGEQSGHIIFSKHARTGDGILTSLMVMEAVIEKKQTLGTLADEVKIFPQLLKNVRVKDKKTALDNAAVQAAVEKTAEELGTDGRILVRESGTEPVIRVMVEAASDEICEKYVDSVVKVIESEGLCE